jgi:chromosome segregation ATPase
VSSESRINELIGQAEANKMQLDEMVRSNTESNSMLVKEQASSAALQKTYDDQMATSKIADSLTLELLNQVEKGKEESAALRESLEELTTDSEIVNGRVVFLQGEAKQDKAAVDRLSEEKVVLEGQIDVLAANKIVNEGQIAVLQDQLIHKESALTMSKEEFAALRESLEELTTDSEIVNGRVVFLQGEAKQDKASVDRLSDEKVVLDSRIVDLEGLLAKEEASSAALDSRVVDLEEQIASDKAASVILRRKSIEKSIETERALNESIAVNVSSESRINELENQIDANKVLLDKIVNSNAKLLDESLAGNVSSESRINELVNQIEINKLQLDEMVKSNAKVDSMLVKEQASSAALGDLNFCVHCLCHIGWVYVFYRGHVDRIDYMKPFSI